MSPAPFSLPDQAAALLNVAVSGASAIGGGSLSEVLRLRLADGHTAIAKAGPDPVAEARMLGAIAEAGVAAPRVLGASPQCLILEALRGDGTLADAWQDLGAQLRLLHATTGAEYGWDRDYAFATVAIVNERTTSWPEFWATHRLLTHAPHVEPSVARRIESLARHIHEELPSAPAASLLHGDLWGGNVLVDRDRVSGLIDPACYFGHGEVDIAMLSLFDRPSDDFYAAYGSLDPGHSRRLAIYSLWPALVHLRLFGQAYRPMVDRFLTAADH